MDLHRPVDIRVSKGWFDAQFIIQSVNQCHETQPKIGGLRFSDLEYLQLQRNGAWEILSEWGNSILEGKDIVNLEFPIEFFEPRSALERLVLGFCYAPVYLSKYARPFPPQSISASSPSDEELALMRFKSVITFIFSGLHLTPTQRMPFNPVLGETFQASLNDGTSIFVEQISHHPPISRWKMTSPAGDFIFSGQVVWSVSGLGNSMKSQQKGECCVEFTSNGQKIYFELPYVSIGGLLWGDRTFDFSGTIKFRDEANQLYCDLVFHPDVKGTTWWKKIFKKSKAPKDCARGSILKGPLREEIAVVEGSWLTHLQIDEEVVWTNGVEQPSSITPDPNALSTDSRFREDIQALAEGDLERAEELKKLVEEKQRYLRKVEQSQDTASTTSNIYNKSVVIIDPKQQQQQLSSPNNKSLSVYSTPVNSRSTTSLSTMDGNNSNNINNSNSNLAPNSPTGKGNKKWRTSIESVDSNYEEAFYDAHELPQQRRSSFDKLKNEMLKSPQGRKAMKNLPK